MMKWWCVLIVSLASHPVTFAALETRYSNSFAVEVQGGRDKADEIAAKHGFINMGPIGSLRDKYFFVTDIDNRFKKGSSVKDVYNLMQYQQYRQQLLSEPEVTFVEQQTLHTHVKKYIQVSPSRDPIWKYEWGVNNTGQTGETELLLDINVEPAWIQGYTGNGVIVAVVDDGVEYEHSDLQANYESSNSYNYQVFSSDPAPMTYFDSHGTSVAGQIAMGRDNGYCGVGVAYDAKYAGLLLLGDATTGSQDAGALSHNRNDIDIYSNSWGPPDDGFTVSGPGSLVDQAFMEGATQGRRGLGNIFTWAAGNGGSNYSFDACSADGYVQSIYTIPVGAYSENGGPAYYDERCSAKMTVSFVDNKINASLQVATTTLNSECTLTFDGTSAATPYVSAVIALTLDANPSLTWRDVEYLIVYTSNPDDLLDTGYDFTNGAGLRVSHHYGFGAIDGEAMVTRAQHWTNVPDQVTDELIPSVTGGSATEGSPLVTTFSYSGSIVYLEKIVVTMSANPVGFTKDTDDAEAYDDIYNDFYYLNYDFYDSRVKRGDISATLTSPQGSTSTILFNRPYDIVTEGYEDWPLLSVLHWGENPQGQWTLQVNWKNSEGYANVSGVSVTLYGTASIPSSVASIPDECSPSCARSKGCAAAGAEFCDACNSTLLRNATTLECISPDECTASIASGYCYVPMEPTTESPSSSSAASISMVVVFAITFVVAVLNK